MSIAGYLTRRRPQACVAEPGGQNALVRSDGLVLSGLATPDERAAEDSVDALEAARVEGTRMPGGLIRVKVVQEFYASVEDYDQVLAWHCRL